MATDYSKRLDGSAEETTESLKQLFGLREDQTFQDLDVDVIPDEDGNKKSN